MKQSSKPLSPLFSHAQHTLKATFAAALLSVASVASMASLPSISSTAAFVSMVAGLVVEDVAFAATNKPVAGVGIKVCKRPGGSSARTKATTSDANGNFSFTGLEAGNYEVTVGNGAVQMFIVGEDGMLSGAAVQDTTTRAVQTNGPVLPITEKGKSATMPPIDPQSVERPVRKDNSKGHKPIEGVPSTY